MFNAVCGSTAFGLGSLLLKLANSGVALRSIATAGSTFLTGAFWCVQLKGNVGKLHIHGNAKLVVKSNTCLLKFLIAKVISRRVNEFQLLGFECCIAILEHPISIFLDKMDNSSVILPIQKNGNDLEVSLLNHHWDLAGNNFSQLLLKAVASFDICDVLERWPVELLVLCESKKEVEMLLSLTSPIPVFPNVRNCMCKHLLILGLQIFPFPPDQGDMQAANGLEISSVFALIDYRCISKVDASAVPGYNTATLGSVNKFFSDCPTLEELSVFSMGHFHGCNRLAGV